MSTPSAPGWYDDPERPDEQLRYFDGILWTAHTTPTSGGRASAAGPSGPSAQAPAGEVLKPYGSPYPPGAAQPGPSRPAYPPYGSTHAQRLGDRLPDGAVLATWWQRLLARVVDGLVTALLTLAIAWPWTSRAWTAYTTLVQETMRRAQAGQELPDTTAFAATVAPDMAVIQAIGIAVALVYEVAFLVGAGATPGKLMLGIGARPLMRDGKPSMTEAVRRQSVYVASAALSLIPVLGVFAPVLRIVDDVRLLVDPQRQTWHDKLAGTVVVRRR